MSAKEVRVAQEGQLIIKYFAFNRYSGKKRGTSTKVHELSGDFILVNMCLMLFIFTMVGVTVTDLRPYVTGSNDAILNEVGQTMTVSLMGAYHGPGVASGHFLVVPPGNISLRDCIGMTSRDWRLSSHKGQWRFYDRNLPHGSMMNLGYYYGLPWMNAGEHSYGGSSRYLSCLPRAPIRCRKPSGSTL
jgi:hypothetical protein